MTNHELSRRVSLRSRKAEFESLPDLDWGIGYLPLQNELNRARLEAAYQVWWAKQHPQPYLPDQRPGPD